jgi:uncharacterized protein YxeA
MFLLKIILLVLLVLPQLLFYEDMQMDGMNERIKIEKPWMKRLEKYNYFKSIG